MGFYQRDICPVLESNLRCWLQWWCCYRTSLVLETFITENGKNKDWPFMFGLVLGSMINSDTLPLIATWAWFLWKSKETQILFHFLQKITYKQLWTELFCAHHSPQHVWIRDVEWEILDVLGHNIQCSCYFLQANPDGVSLASDRFWSGYFKYSKPFFPTTPLWINPSTEC